jgi:hypothetical protein
MGMEDFCHCYRLGTRDKNQVSNRAWSQDRYHDLNSRIARGERKGINLGRFHDHTRAGLFSFSLSEACCLLCG